jgi:hypothetical protein
MTKLLLLSAVYAMPVLATESQEALLNNLTTLEGEAIVAALSTDIRYVRAQSSTIVLSANPVYNDKELGAKCRTVIIRKATEEKFKACKVGGDWVFLYE